MPTNKKGSRLAASQARARAAARKKTRTGGPDLSGATKPVPIEAEEAEEEEVEAANGLAERAASQPIRVPINAPSPYRRAATRRERQALTVVSGGSLKWELTLITIITACAGGALAALKLFTDFGR